MKNKITLISSLFFCLIISHSAFATTLQEAKSQGLVGEQIDGYVGLVADSIPNEVRALVQDVNDQRKQLYAQIAAENNLEIEQVRLVAYERAVQATQSGHYIQNSSGNWVKK